MTVPGSEALSFTCGNDALVGILTTGVRATEADTAVVIIVGGPQYRAGSHRQFTLLARACAHAGFPVLRFDVRGMGDSTGELRSFDDLDEDVAAAVDALFARVPGLRRVVLWGLCDGASAALLYVARRRDNRVAGLVLLNPWVRSPVSLARTHARHYYVQRLGQAEFWRKLLSGRVALRAARDLWQTLKLAFAASSVAGERHTAAKPFHARMADGWRHFDGPILLVLSGDDYVAKEFRDHASTSPDWRECLVRPQVTRVDFDAANHTFSDPADSHGVESETVDWLHRSFAASRHQGAAPPPMSPSLPCRTV